MSSEKSALLKSALVTSWWIMPKTSKPCSDTKCNSTIGGFNGGFSDQCRKIKFEIPFSLKKGVEEKEHNHKNSEFRLV